MYVQSAIQPGFQSVRGIGDDTDASGCPTCSCFSGHVIGFLFGALAIFMLQETVRSGGHLIQAQKK